MKKALVLQHMDHDHPGRFADFFAEDGLLPTSIRLWEGQSVPALKDFDLMFVLGGAQNTWEEDEYPWLRVEKDVIREWVWDRAKPYFGVCLGHQLLAASLGGEVGMADEGEMGVCEVTQTADGVMHEVMANVPYSMPVMQWHHAEIKRMPQSALCLASSGSTEVQIQAIGNHAFSTQFHCEFTPQTVMGWTSMPGYIKSLEVELGAGAFERVQAQSFPLMPQMAKATKQMWDNFKRVSGLLR